MAQCPRQILPAYERSIYNDLTKGKNPPFQLELDVTWDVVCRNRIFSFAYGNIDYQLCDLVGITRTFGHVPMLLHTPRFAAIPPQL